MIRYLTFLIFLSFVSCSSIFESFDESFYEEVTGIQLPSRYHLLESFDNGEYLTSTSFQIDSVSLAQLVAINGFKKMEAESDIHFISAYWYKKYPPDYKGADVFFLNRSKGNHNWRCLANLNSGKLWIEIDYPDFGGK